MMYDYNKTPSMDSTFVTSDSHFGHGRIIIYENRQFETADEMDKGMIWQWNRVVGSDDEVYHGGDFTLGNKLAARRYFHKLNGKIRVLSNPWHHDKKWFGGEYFSASGHKVEYVPAIVVFEYAIPLIMCHYPFAEGRWDRGHYGSYHLHGHSHGKGGIMKNALDVTVDSIARLTGQYRPVSIREAIGMINAERS
jgi:calcineurin-like phosphoesterase family protein